MSGVDLTIFAILAISVIVSLFRGFIKEVFSLLVWIAAFFAASQFSAPLAEALEPHVAVPSARVVLAFVAVFLLMLAFGGLLTYLVGKLVEHTGLSATDRLFGSLFGLLRGLVIIMIAVVLARFTPFPEDPWWQNSALLSRFEQMADWAIGFLPPVMQDVLDQNEDTAERTGGERFDSSIPIDSAAGPAPGAA